MKKSHSRQTYPLEKSPDRAIRHSLRGSLRQVSKTWQAIKRLQNKKRRHSTVDQFGFSVRDAAVDSTMFA